MCTSAALIVHTIIFSTSLYLTLLSMALKWIIVFNITKIAKTTRKQLIFLMLEDVQV